MEQKKVWKKIKVLWGWLKENGNLILSVLIALAFLVSPPLLKFDCFSNLIDGYLHYLKNAEYKAAYIGASGGMIGSFLAITGAIWIERKLLRYRGCLQELGTNSRPNSNTTNLYSSNKGIGRLSVSRGNTTPTLQQ